MAALLFLLPRVGLRQSAPFCVNAMLAMMPFNILHSHGEAHALMKPAYKLPLHLLADALVPVKTNRTVRR